MTDKRDDPQNAIARAARISGFVRLDGEMTGARPGRVLRSYDYR